MLTTGPLDWLAEAIDEGAITSHAALSAIGFDATPARVMEFAPILIPRGVEPSALAALVSSGTWIGSTADRYEGLADGFRAEINNQDESIQAVAAAGVKFCEAHVKSASETDRKRLTGEE